MSWNILIWLRGIMMPLVLLIAMAILAKCQNLPAQADLSAEDILFAQAGRENLEIGIDENTATFQLAPDNLLEAIYQGKRTLQQMEIKHSSEVSSYKVKRMLSSGAVYEYEERDCKWKEVALQLINLKTGEVRFVKVLKVLDELVYTEGDFTFQLEGRPAGPLWGAYRTPIRVISPPEWAVIANKYKRYSAKTGKVEEIVYSASSEVLGRPEFISEGMAHWRDDIDEAIDEILKLKPVNVDLPLFAKGRKWVAQVSERIGLIEQTDPYEVLKFDGGGNDYNPFRRVYLEMFLNQDSAFSAVVSSENAAGLMQFTKLTWNSMMAEFSWALLPNFEIGAADHVQSVKAHILLHNYNLKMLNNEFKTDIMKWREPEHYLAACYNGSPSAIVKAMKWANARGAGSGKWRERLPRYQRNRTTETYYFLKKLDAVIKHEYGVR